MPNEKRTSIVMPADLHYQLKVRLAIEKITFTDWVIQRAKEYVGRKR